MAHPDPAQEAFERGMKYETGIERWDDAPFGKPTPHEQDRAKALALYQQAAAAKNPDGLAGLDLKQGQRRALFLKLLARNLHANGRAFMQAIRTPRLAKGQKARRATANIAEGAVDRAVDLGHTRPIDLTAPGALAPFGPALHMQFDGAVAINNGRAGFTDMISSDDSQNTYPNPTSNCRAS